MMSTPPTLQEFIDIVGQCELNKGNWEKLCEPLRFAVAIVLWPKCNEICIKLEQSGLDKDQWMESYFEQEWRQLIHDADVELKTTFILNLLSKLEDPEFARIKKLGPIRKSIVDTIRDTPLPDQPSVEHLDGAYRQAVLKAHAHYWRFQELCSKHGLPLGSERHIRRLMDEIRLHENCPVTEATKPALLDNIKKEVKRNRIWDNEHLASPLISKHQGLGSRLYKIKEQRQEVREQLEEFVASCQALNALEAVEEVSDEDDRLRIEYKERDPYRERAIRDLRQIFEEATGKLAKPPSQDNSRKAQDEWKGEFYHFVRDVFRADERGEWSVGLPEKMRRYRDDLGFHRNTKSKSPT